MSLQFRISGRVVDRESGAGVAGLLVRAYDKDLLFDDLLGSATTGADGRFELHYAQSDFRELFERRPDVYLSLYDGPGKFLLHTKDAIRWNAGTDETFEVKIDRRPAQRAENEVGTSLGLPKSAMKIEERGGFVVPRIRGFATGGEPGAPALPRQLRFVALPLGGDVLKVDVNLGEPVRIAASGTPLPAQEPFPDEGVDEETGRPLGGTPPFTPANPRLFSAAYPQELVRLVRVEDVGPVQVAALEVRPVQYDPSARAYLFYPDLEYTVTFDRDKAKRTQATSKVRLGEFYAEDLQAMLSSDRVIVAEMIDWPIYVLEESPHLIITDNVAWPATVANPDGTTRPPNDTEHGAALAGDLVAEFQRLADWRTGQGMRSKVVTVTEIVSGKFGDFTEGGFARDLQEVIRNFMKFAHETWDTRYAILGGDVNVVPVRLLTGAGTYHTFGMNKVNTNPPADSEVRVSGTVAKLHPQFTPAPGDPLSTYNGGLRIPYNREAGPGYLGWYYTTEADFDTKESGFTRNPDATKTRFIIVEGPAAVLDDHYYFVRDVNLIPSDLYYASLVGPQYSKPGKHDFDTSNNGLYGQSAGDTILDGIDLASDVWVGRVPAESGAEVKAFVDKLMTYEELRVPGTAGSIDASYLKKILYAADHWGRASVSKQSDTATPPEDGRFTHVDGTTTTKVHADFALVLESGNPSHRLVANLNGEEVVVPYNTSANASNTGWFFTTSDTYATQSATATRFVKVRGPESQIDAASFFWDPVVLEGAAQEKENLRAMMNSWWPAFNSVQRHFSDYFELVAPPPFVPLESQTLRDAMNAGAHFVSLTGHGSPGGCCGASASAGFTNDRKFYIAYANSCSTARPDSTNDSLGERTLTDPDGGAVAYVGNTRYGWIWNGNEYEESFWCALRAFGRVGPAAGLRLATNNATSVWSTYTSMLYGDPAMKVWDHVPKQLTVLHPPVLERVELLPFEVLVDNQPVRDARVTVRGKDLFLSKKTSPEGRVAFELPADAGEVEVTVTSRQGTMYRARLQ